MLALAAAAGIDDHGIQQPSALLPWCRIDFGRPMKEIVRAQVGRGAPAFCYAGLEHTMTAIQASGHVPGQRAAELQALFPPYAGPVLQGRLLSFDPAQALLGLDLACLLLQGAADRQVVPMGDVQPLIDALSKRSARRARS